MYIWRNVASVRNLNIDNDIHSCDIDAKPICWYASAKLIRAKISVTWKMIEVR